MPLTILEPTIVLIAIGKLEAPFSVKQVVLPLTRVNITWLTIAG
jgi:hypothetical protein